MNYDELLQKYQELKNEFETFKIYYQDAVFKHNEKRLLKPYQIELLKLQRHLEKTNKKIIILFEGRDASGKGGTIRRITRYMNEKHYRVVALGKPSDVQKTQWFFQRYTEQFPRAGEIVLFDRSWYNRAMVEPIFGFCTPREHKIFMKEVIKFEENLVSEGIILIKLYFSVSKEEQAKRFNLRQNDPLKKWKFSEVDMQAQDLWGEFSERKFGMLRKTHTTHAPWFVIRSNDKFLARKETMKIILNIAKYRGRKRTLDFDINSKIVIRGDSEYKDMKDDLKKYGKFLG